MLVMCNYIVNIIELIFCNFDRILLKICMDLLAAPAYIFVFDTPFLINSKVILQNSCVTNEDQLRKITRGKKIKLQTL